MGLYRTKRAQIHCVFSKRCTSIVRGEEVANCNHRTRTKLIENKARLKNFIEVGANA